MSEPPSYTKLFMPHLLVGIFLILSGFAFLGMSFSPFEHPTSAIYYRICGIILIIGGILSVIVFIVKPERLKKKVLAKWEKKQAIK